MANVGISPIDKDSPVGKLRLSIGDTNSKPLDPVVDGKADYANLSDAELEGFLESADGSTIRATGFAYLRLATIAAARTVTIKTNDLGYANERRATELRELAKLWFAQADAADENAADDNLEIVRYPGRDNSDPALPSVM